MLELRAYRWPILEVFVAETGRLLASQMEAEIKRRFPKLRAAMPLLLVDPVCPALVSVAVVWAAAAWAPWSAPPSAAVSAVAWSPWAYWVVLACRSEEGGWALVEAPFPQEWALRAALGKALRTVLGRALRMGLRKVLQTALRKVPWSA
jgi:hypothetical protein